MCILVCTCFFFTFFFRFRLIKTTYQRATTAVLITRFRDVRKITDFEPVRGEGSRAFWSTFCTPHFFGLNAAMHEPRRFPRTENTLLYMSLPREMPWFAFFCVFCVHRWQKILHGVYTIFRKSKKIKKRQRCSATFFSSCVFFFVIDVATEKIFREHHLVALHLASEHFFFSVRTFFCCLCIKKV